VWPTEVIQPTSLFGSSAILARILLALDPQLCALAFQQGSLVVRNQWLNYAVILMIDMILTYWEKSDH
jgi:hypothetical protein